MQPNTIANECYGYNAIWKEMDHHVWWYFKHTVTIINHCDHNYEISSYICNPFRFALIWPGNSFEEIRKWEIGASNYLDISVIYILLQDDFPTLLLSQTSLSAHSSFQVKRDFFHNLFHNVFLLKSPRTWLHCSSKCFSLSSSFSKGFIKMFAT